jgi:hypothetical protein
VETLGPSFVAAIILASMYALEGRLGGTSSERIWLRRRWISAAAGVSVSYVLLAILPELAALQKVSVNADGNLGLRFAEGHVYLLTLLAFGVFYGLEHLVASARQRQMGYIAEPNAAIFRLQVSAFAVYSCLIGYVLPERSARGWVALGTYSLVMALQALIVGHSLGEEHGSSFDRRRRWLLVVSVLSGCLLGEMTDMSERVFGRVFAVLAGCVLVTSLKVEFPDDRKGRFWPFCSGAALFALVILWSEAVSA